MKFSWKKSTFTLFTGLLITGCATSRQDSPKPLLMGARGGVVPQPYEEPKAPKVIEKQTPIIGGAFIDPVAPIEPVVPVVVEPIAPIEPVAPVKKSPAQNKANLEKYTVVKGDSLSRIAYKYKGFSYFELAKVNGIDVKKPLKVGQVLVIPAKGVKKKLGQSTPKKTTKKTTHKKKSTSRTSSKKPIPSNGKYVVKSGDSLWLIAHRYGVSTKTIKSLNNLKSETLHIGNVLILKGDAKAEVKPAVAEKKAVKNEVKPLTPLTPEVAVEKVEPVAEVAPVEEIDNSVFVEEVTIDENNKDIKSIADMFNTSIEAIRAQNKGVDLNNLKIGQIIKVPLDNN